MVTATPRGRVALDADTLFTAYAAIRDRHLSAGKSAGELLDSLKAEGPAEMAALGWDDGAHRRTQKGFALAVGQARSRLINEVYSAVDPSIRPGPRAIHQSILAMAGDSGPGQRQRQRQLTPEQVRFIRREYRPGHGSITNGCALARLFGVNSGLVYQIAHGMAYRDVPTDEEVEG